MSRDTVAWVVWMPTRPRRSTSSSWVAIWCLAIRERIASCRLRFDMREGLLHACRRRAPENIARFQCAFQRQVVDGVRAEERRKLLQLRQGVVLQTAMRGDRVRHHRAHEVMRVAKWHAFPGQVISELGCQRVARG